MTEAKSRANQPIIGTLAERSLHSDLKTILAEPDDLVEQKVDGFVIDIVRGEQLIEIQTRNFSAMKRKLAKLLPTHPIRLIHPIARRKWIVRQDKKGVQVARRKSPKRGRLVDIFRELVYIPHLLSEPNLVIEVWLIHEDEIWRDDGKGSWRRKRWSVVDRQLVEVESTHQFPSLADYLSFIPESLEKPFTNRELSTALGCRYDQAQKMTYTLLRAGLLEHAGKRGRSKLFHPISQ